MVVTAKSSMTAEEKKKQHTYPKRFLVSDSGLKERKKNCLGYSNQGSECCSSGKKKQVKH